jgi:cysteinyl-tRNA synthetase
MTVRFFILQAHYRSTLDFGNEALQAAEKGLARFLKGVETINQLKAGESTTEFNVADFENRSFEFLNDDLSTPRLIANIYEAIHFANLVVAGKASISADDLKQLQTLINTLVFDILGLKAEEHTQQAATAGLVEFLLKLRSEAKANKDYAKSDQIRDELVALGIQIMDSKSGTTWTFA